jgi:hypothetical protein
MSTLSTQAPTGLSLDRQKELATPPSRDLRIDFFRGIALLIVVIDHIEGWSGRSVIELWTLISLGFSDAAEIFVFVSGYVFAVAYSRTLDRSGFWACMKKALKRAFQIYIAYVLAAVAVIAIGAWYLDWNPPQYNEQLRIGQRVTESILAALTVRFHPWGFDILAMYIPVIPWMALLLYVQRRSVWLAWLLSGGLYLTVQFFPGVNFTRFGDGEQWYFNPLAWQFLFYLGIYLGDPRRKPLNIVPRWLLVTLSVAMLLAGFFVMKASLWMVQSNGALWETFQPMYRVYWGWGGKTTLQPLRLLHFFALAYLTSQLLPRNLSFWTSWLARPIIVAGQHSLEVYAFQLVVSFVGVFMLSMRFQYTSDVVMLDIVACVLSIGFAYVVAWWQGPKAVPQLAPAVQHAPKADKSRRRASKNRPHHR